MRVLLIEDDSAVAQSIELMLKVDNFNVYTTDLGEEGIDLGLERLVSRTFNPAPRTCPTSLSRLCST